MTKGYSAGFYGNFCLKIQVKNISAATDDYEVPRTPHPEECGFSDRLLSKTRDREEVFKMKGEPKRTMPEDYLFIGTKLGIAEINEIGRRLGGRRLKMGEIGKGFYAYSISGSDSEPEPGWAVMLKGYGMCKAVRRSDRAVIKDLSEIW